MFQQGKERLPVEAFMEGSLTIPFERAIAPLPLPQLNLAGDIVETLGTEGPSFPEVVTPLEREKPVQLRVRGQRVDPVVPGPALGIARAAKSVDFQDPFSPTKNVTAEWN